MCLRCPICKKTKDVCKESICKGRKVSVEEPSLEKERYFERDKKLPSLRDRKKDRV